MTAESALMVISVLKSRGVNACIGGGWAIDALLGEQTREHADLDIWLPAADLDPTIVAFSEAGIDRLLPWGGDRPWNFVLHDGRSLRVDLHLYEELPGGLIHYGSVLNGDRFANSCLDGTGRILGNVVRCETSDWALQCHLEYPPRATDFHDVTQLCAKFGLPVPEPYRSHYRGS
ncbi:nucleotidyltransferase domain-containing protein [Nocardia terpenica]|uniref:Aminoglycoside nucleotidyltransferase n=1 Tax=Nocardia terpenica TaxID=455432 RepID=A0A291RMZ6_9NOCA|nr:aminoglycoside nucleotidyltransferase [Nocardia terpenica]ATL68956.1 aminoglycoside nucleotidyltransferase [Nocardia terpenica]